MDLSATVLLALVAGHCLKCDAKRDAAVPDVARSTRKDCDDASQDEQDSADEVRLCLAFHSPTIPSRYVSAAHATTYQLAISIPSHSNNSFFAM